MTTTIITTRAEAVASGSKHYFTGKPCKAGHLSPRNTKTSACLGCQRLGAATRYAANPDKQKAANEAYRAANLEKVKEANRRASLKYRAENLEEIQAKEQARREANPEVNREAQAAHRAGPAMPPWADREALRAMYALVPEGWHLDHVIPLNHPEVCGLHVPQNLRILPASVNIAKRREFVQADPLHHESAFKALAVILPRRLFIPAGLLLG